MHLKDLVFEKVNTNSDLGKVTSINQNLRSMTDKGKKIQNDFLLLLDQIRANTINIGIIREYILELTEELGDLNHEMEHVRELVTSIPNISAVSKSTDYNVHIIGARDSVNKVFTPRYNFVPNSMEVWVNGQKQTPGTDYDYVEVGNTSVFFTYAPLPTDNLIFNYSISI